MEGIVARDELLEALAQLIAKFQPGSVIRVAVDGPDTAGKTTLADELAERLDGKREVIRAGIDGFHRPRSERLQRGSLSPAGYYHDSFDYQALRTNLLDPLSPGGDRRYRPAVFDHRSDQPHETPVQDAGDTAVLLFDGVFLLRPELRACWELCIFLRLSDDEILRRAVVRDTELMGGTHMVHKRYQQRYLPGQKLYREAARPEDVADIVIDHDYPAEPRVAKWRFESQSVDL